MLFIDEGTIRINQNLKFLSMMEAAGKGEVVKAKRDDQGEKCPKFEGNKDEYQEWRGKVEDWVWM